MSNMPDHCFAATTIAAADTGELEVWQDRRSGDAGYWPRWRLASTPVEVLEALSNAFVELLHVAARLVPFLCLSLFHDI